MEYFDSKVLESFMIPEDSIATEGFGSKVVNIVQKFFQFILSIIDKIMLGINKIINKLKHGKNVHTDTKMYKENDELRKLYYQNLITLLNNIPNAIFLLSNKAYLVSPGIIDNERENNDSDFEKRMESIKREWDVLSKMYAKVENGLSDKTLYLNKEDHDYIFTNLTDSKSELIKAKEKIKKTLDEMSKEKGFVLDEITPDLFAESQKRCAKINGYVSRFSTLFMNTESLIMKCISSDILTMEDAYNHA